MWKRYSIIIVLLIYIIQPAMGLFENGEVEPTQYHQFVITSVSPTEFYPSDIKTINITMQNIYNYSAYGVSTVIDKDKADPMKITHELQKYVGNEINGNQNFTIQYEIHVNDDVAKGTYYIPLAVLWSTVADGTVKHQEDLYIGINVIDNPEANKIEITNITLPEKIYAGNDFRVKFTIKNIGETKINIIRASIPIQLPFSSKNSSTEKYIQSLEPNQSTEIEYDFYMDKSAMSRVYNLNLTLQYKDFLNRLMTQQSYFGVPVEEDPHIYISDIIIYPTTVKPGDEALLTMQLVNAGTNEIKNIKISIKGGDGILMQTENSIGQLSPTKSLPLSFGIYANSKLIPRNYGLSIFITYQDINGNNHQYSYLYPISIVSIPLLPIPSLLTLISVFGFILFTYIIFLIKGRRIEKKMRERKYVD